MTKKALHVYICITISITAGLSSLLLNLEEKNPVSISTVEAKTRLEITGWIPYWSVSTGIRDAKSHLSELTRIYAFSYSVDKDGKLKDLSNLKSSSWKSLMRSAKSEDVAVIPTVMWSDGANIHKILSNPISRGSHVQNIVAMVREGKYSGVDIDYEGKLTATKDYFSAFLRELKTALGSKMLICTIEARTPADSLNLIPKAPQYSNDYAVIGSYCDRVQLMTYDQGRADIKLNSLKAGMPYVPVSDVDWVRKVVELTVQSIPKEKLLLGVATYSREYEITVSPNWFQGYRQIRSLTAEDAEKLAKEYKVTPSRNQAGEISFSYIPKSSSVSFSKSLTVPKNTSSGNTVAAKALAYANATGKTVTFNLVWWSDADAIEDKVKLAKEFGLAGIAIFKIDGKEDDDLWEVFE